MINALHLKQLGFKKEEEKEEWIWGTYTHKLKEANYKPIVFFLEKDQTVISNITTVEGTFKIVKKVTIIKEIEQVMNMASFVLSKK